MKLKKVIALLTCTTILITTVTGCSNSKNGENNNTSESNTPVTEAEGSEESGSNDIAEGSSTEFWLDKLAEQAKGDMLSEAWKADSGIDVKLVNYPDVAAYQTSVQQSIDSSTGPGMFTWWSGSQLEILAKNGKLMDLTSEWDNYIADGVPADIKEAFTVEGKAYAAPYSILYNVCYYNKELFENAGITDLPKTFDEFLEACEKLKESGVTPIGLKNDSWASFIWFQQLVAAYDSQLYIDLCNGTKSYTDDGVKEVMNIWKEMFDKGYFGKPVLYSDMYKNLATGKTAIILEASPTATVLTSEYGMESGVNLDAFAVPSMQGKKSTIFFEASPLCVSAASADNGGAIQALRNFYKPATQQVLVDELGIANTNGVKIKDAAIQNIVNMANDSEHYELILRFYENTNEEIRNYAIDELAKFIYSGADIDEILNNIQIKAEEVWGQ